MASSACGERNEHPLRRRHARDDRAVRLSGRGDAQAGVVRMTANGYLQLWFYIVVLLALAKPLGAYMARIYEGQPAFLNRVGAPVEQLLYKVCGIDPDREM